jgi:hypothetical protein
MKVKRIVEITAWIIIAILFGWRLFAFIYSRIHNNENIPFLYEFYSDIIYCSMAIIFPVIFKVIFDELPFEYISNRNIEKKKEKTMNSKQSIINQDLDINIQSSLNHEIRDKLDSEKYLMILANDSKKLSEKIYSSSGYYLLIGSLIALIGILFFSIQTINVLQIEKNDISKQIIYMLQRFGILLFIELVAFFFLKQYRTTLDEFRYYECIKRQRESDLAKLIIIEKSEYSADALTLIDKLSFDRQIGNLRKDESTELLELRKLDKSEVDILSKIIDKIPTLKK